MSFFQRVLNYVANEVIVKSLANSPLFQRLALRVHHSIKDVQQKGISSVTDFTKSETFQNAGESAKDVTSRMNTFVSAFRKNIQNEMEALRKQQATAQQQQQQRSTSSSSERK